MNAEHLKLMESLGAQGKAFGEFWERYFTAAFLMHGHLCGGMPLGFRAGVAALKALGREREADMGQIALVETGLGHAAGCFADGVQLSTGCTFGKGLIRRTDYGKWAATSDYKGTDITSAEFINSDGFHNGIAQLFKIIFQGHTVHFRGI